jgi:hypothetical protein
MINSQYNMFLDDERFPKDPSREWVIVRSFEEAVAHVEHNGMPSYCSFDHDLGLAESGYDFAKWIVEMDMSGTIELPPNFSFNVHSANPVGARNIECYLENYLDIKNNR